MNNSGSKLGKIGMARWVPALALATVLLSFSVAQGQSTDRAKQLGGKLICMCNCNQILTACNHVGCTMSTAMLKEMDQRVASNESDDLLLQSFVQEYGERVLAEPSTHGFNSLAWMIPGIAFAMGLGVVVLVIRQWRYGAVLAPAGGGPAVSSEALERARRQADRETDE
jgi:cytochrome c-type biogenesis protein CcmH/NrfF